MATLVSRATGNFTTAGTWGLASVASTAYLDSEAGTTTVTTSVLDSATITPGVETWDGVALKVASRLASPTGTVTVTLRNTTTSTDIKTVTVNATDIDVGGVGWHFFKFASSALTVTANNYVIRVVSSVTSQITLYTNGTANNWSRIISRTTTQAPASTDQLIMVGELTGAGTGNDITVTMNNTAATTFGALATGTDGIAIGKRGICTFGTTASTAYLLKVANRMTVGSGGTLNIGTSGTRMPSTSSGNLTFVNATNVDCGLVVNNNGTFNAYGNQKTNYYTLLTVDAAAAQSTCTVSSTTGWVANDNVVIASTTRTPSQVERKIISTVPGSTSFTVTVALSNAHSGTSPTQGEIGNITRNVKIQGTSITLCAYIVAQATSTIAIDNAEIYFMGSATASKRGIDINTTTGSFSCVYSAIYDFFATGSAVFASSSTLNNVTFSNNIIYNLVNGLYLSTPTSGATLTFNANLVMNCVSYGMYFADIGGTITNNLINSCTAQGFEVADNSGTNGTISGNTIHSCGGIGFNFSGTVRDATFSSFIIWRCNSYGISIGSACCTNLTFDTFTLFGNATANFTIGVQAAAEFYFKSITSNGDTTFSTPYAFYLATQGAFPKMFISGSDFGTASGIKTTHSTADISIASSPIYTELILRNTKLSSSTELGGQTNLTSTAFIGSEKNDQTANNHKYWKKYGSGIIDTTFYKTTSPSERMTPNNASSKVEATSKIVTVASGATLSVNVYVRKSASGDGAAYNGNQPRLICKANPALGVTADTVLATMSASTGTWQQLTGTSPTATGDAGAFEFVVDCDGTAGWINVDDWSLN